MKPPIPPKSPPAAPTDPNTGVEAEDAADASAPGEESDAPEGDLQQALAAAAGKAPTPKDPIQTGTVSRFVDALKGVISAVGGTSANVQQLAYEESKLPSTREPLPDPVWQTFWAVAGTVKAVADMPEGKPLQAYVMDPAMAVADQTAMNDATGLLNRLAMDDTAKKVLRDMAAKMQSGGGPGGSSTPSGPPGPEGSVASPPTT